MYFALSDAVLLILGIYVTKLKPLNICGFGILVSLSTFFLKYKLVNSIFHSCKVPLKMYAKILRIKKQLQGIAQISILHIFLSV